MISKRDFLAGSVAVSLVRGLMPGVAQAGEAVATVPIHVYRDRVTVIPVTLNGKGPYWFAMGTASPLNVIDPDLAADLGLAPAHALRNAVFGNKTVSLGEVGESREVACDAVAVGGHTLPPLTFTVSSETPDQVAKRIKHMGRPDYPRGVLGTKTFLYGPCLIDFAAGQLSYYTPGTLDLTGFDAVDIHVDTSGFDSDKALSVNTHLGGERLACYPDSGGNTELYLTSKYVKKHRLWNASQDFIESPLNLDDPSKGFTRVVRMRDFQLGPLHFDEINVTLGCQDHPDRLDEIGVTAVVGRRLLSQAELAFSDGGLFMRANAAFKPVSGPYEMPERDED